MGGGGGGGGGVQKKVGVVGWGSELTVGCNFQNLLISGEEGEGEIFVTFYFQWR